MAVTNDDELRAWLEEQSRETCTAIAHRAAMRVLPIAMDLDGFDGAEDLALVTLRCCLTSGVATVWPTPDVKDKVKQAAGAAYSAARSAARSAYSAADSARSADSAFSAAFSADSAASIFSAARSAAFSAVSAAFSAVSDYSAADSARSATYADMEIEVDRLMRVAISVPDLVKDLHAEVASNGRSALEAGGPWAFWAEWYARAMKGEPLDWALQEKIALIEDDVWKRGVEAVAEAIARIEEQFYGAPLSDKDASAEALRLSGAPSYYADIFSSASVSVAYHVDLFKTKADLNGLPNGFTRLETLEKSFASFGDILRERRGADDEIAILTAKVQQQYAVIQELRRELRETRAALVSANCSPEEASRLRKIGAAALVVLASAGSLGGIASGVEAGFQLNERRLQDHENLRSEVVALAETMQYMECLVDPFPPTKK